MLTDPARADDTPDARPLFIAQDSHYLFAWHHPARPSVRRGAAVVLCPSLFVEFISAFRVWRRLAGDLAGSGFDVFRFDYEGTGDSSGDLAEPARVDAWLRNIKHLADEARNITGASEIALVGLRIGATLAVQAAAANGGVDRLVLWSPFRSGRAYVRELRAFDKLTSEIYVTRKEQGADILVGGNVLPAPVAMELEQLNLDALPIAPAPHILLVEHDDRPTDPAVAERLRKLGSCVTSVRPQGTSKMLDPWPSSPVPDHAREVVASWLKDWSTRGHGSAQPEKAATASSELVHGSGYHERAVYFGSDRRLFGMLSIPNGADSAAPAIILLNTGYETRIGPHRFFVPIAREWAEQGHVVLRYDLGGIGDSEAPAGARDNVPYPTHALDDARAAIAFIRTQAPGRRVIVAGLCSGGWHAFLAAREGLPIDAVISINPPLYLRDGMTRTRAWNDYQQIETYRTGLLEAARWKRALQGRSAYRSFLRLAALYAVKKVKGLIGVFGGEFVDGLARDLTAISARGIPCLFVFSRGDGGFEYFQLHANGALRRSERAPIQFEVVDNAGHTFNPPDAQRELRSLLLDYVAWQTRETRRARVESSRAVETSVPHTVRR